MNFKENETATKLRGGYYTSPEIASFLLRWVAHKNPRRLLEPSCGDGVFFREMQRISGLRDTEVLGFEIEPQEAAKAIESLRTHSASSEVQPRDFLQWSLRNVMAPSFDAAVGNPPFIRYQYLDASLQALAEKLFKTFHLPFTKHTNAWVSFVIGSLASLRSGGRLAMVVPAELLHVLHAQSLRTFLSGNCSRILIFDPEELWFADALQGAVILLAEKKQHATDPCEGVAIIRTKSPAFLASDPEQFFQDADYSAGETISGKWMRSLLTHRQRELLEDARHRPSVRRFSEVADASVGIVTGANKFFLVSDQTVQQYGLKPWASPMFGRSDHVRGVIYDDAEHQRNREEGLPTNFIWFNAENSKKLPASVRAYLQTGEDEMLHTRFKCRIREPWYAVPSVFSAPVGMLKRSHDFPRLIHNSIGAFTTDTAYRVTPKSGITPETLVYSFLNSLTALSAELEGRHYGGGVLELVPSEISRLLLPLRKSNVKELRVLDNDVRTRSDAESLLAEQDSRVLLEVGFDYSEAEELRETWMMLRNRRHRQSDDSTDQATSKANDAVELAGA